MRITNHPILTFAQGNFVKFTFNGQELEGIAGEPIAASLHAAGIKVFRHSHERSRPRGLFCAIGNCSSCLMVVNGVPNVRVCVAPLESGMKIETQTGRGILL
ncbi:MAG TPA: (2Fe-2S)-binding protein [Methylomusa anaerophila]|uniref:Hydrogen cyanide synthase subunit HcnA n=1 Tax=Methylomusa anaerophila TaxID=1930071 RepID=A0A348APJ9_9FIRM|nr:(2Fe-2S)-binding protein [Methylomusa anaerophila]BBB92997.1 hydrogen cyanide synthase subunit HcnA [Methylomusa anaerophila]HML87170.1 (2Fe-2S)-binding protein [Methylomusa anaerophila]